jgi:hypothetical protein
MSPALRSLRSFTRASSWRPGGDELWRQLCGNPAAGRHLCRANFEGQQVPPTCRQVTKVELFINMNTAKAFGIDVPTLPAHADEVIQRVLLRCISPVVALCVNSLRCGNSDAIGGKADIRRSCCLPWSDAIDPKRTSGCHSNPGPASISRFATPKNNAAGERARQSRNAAGQVTRIDARARQSPAACGLGRRRSTCRPWAARPR